MIIRVEYGDAMIQHESNSDALREGEPPLTIGRTPDEPTPAHGYRPCMKTLRVRATGTGRIVDWAALKNGVMIDRSVFSGITTTLPDVITDLCKTAELLDSAFQVHTIVPNGPTRVSLDLRIFGAGFDIVCARRLVRGWFPLNFLAAEFGGNYDVVVTLFAESANIEARFLRMLTSKYDCAWSNGTQATEMPAIA